LTKVIGEGKKTLFLKSQIIIPWKTRAPFGTGIPKIRKKGGNPKRGKKPTKRQGKDKRNLFPGKAENYPGNTGKIIREPYSGIKGFQEGEKINPNKVTF